MRSNAMDLFHQHLSKLEDGFQPIVGGVIAQIDDMFNKSLKPTIADSVKHAVSASIGIVARWGSKVKLFRWILHLQHSSSERHPQKPLYKRQNFWFVWVFLAEWREPSGWWFRLVDVQSHRCTWWCLQVACLWSDWLQWRPRRTHVQFCHHRLGSVI